MLHIDNVRHFRPTNPLQISDGHEMGLVDTEKEVHIFRNTRLYGASLVSIFKEVIKDRNSKRTIFSSMVNLSNDKSNEKEKNVVTLWVRHLQDYGGCWRGMLPADDRTPGTLWWWPCCCSHCHGARAGAGVALWHTTEDNLFTIIKKIKYISFYQCSPSPPQSCGKHTFYLMYTINMDKVQAKL